MKLPVIQLVQFMFLLFVGPQLAQSQDEQRIVYDPYGDTSLEEITPETRARSRGYSPYAGRDFRTRVLFGDTHNHTSNSGDAFMGGNRLTPEQSYRFTRGEEVVSSTGLPAKLSRPLDFLVIADHAEGLGVITEVYNGNPKFVSDPTLGVEMPPEVPMVHQERAWSSPIWYTP